MKKIMALIMACALSLSLLAGCGKNETSSQQNSTEASLNNGNEEEEVKPIKYTIMIKDAIAEYPPDGGVAKKLLQQAWKEKLGVADTDYEVIMVVNADYNTKLNAMMSGGDVPDYFEINIEDLPNLVKNDIIAPVDDVVSLMPAYQKLLDNTANKMSYDNFAVNGVHYAFTQATLDGSLNGPGVKGLIMRTDWLKNLNLKTPTTLDELHDVLLAFTKDDPDGNGKDDTYGLGGDKNGMFSSLFGAYGIFLNGIDSWIEVDGKLVHSTTVPQVKDVLKVLNQWYAEGIIDPDKFVVEEKQSKDKFIAGQIGAYENSVWAANDARVAWSETQPDASCAFVTPPTGPDGESGFPVNPIVTLGRVISKNCIENKDIERFAKILNFSCDTGEDGGMMMVTYGEEGKQYTYDKSTDVVTQLVSDNTELYKLGFSNPVRWETVIDRRWIPQGDLRGVDFQISNDTNNWLISEFSGSVQAMKDYPDLYNKLWNEYFTKIVTGVLPVSAYDEYVEKFYEQGGTELTGQVNEAWAAD